MHDRANTLGGRFGFYARATDGSRLTEREVLWDEVPKDARLLTIGLYDFARDEPLLTLELFERYYFANEAVSIRSQLGQSTLAAKIFGGIRGGVVYETRVGMLSSVPCIEARRNFRADDLRLSQASFRWGGA